MTSKNKEKVAPSTFGATRRAGVLLHISSLPGPFYSGDLGGGAFAFVDWLAKAGASLWQVLPINPVGDAFSPYSTPSSMAGEPILLDLKWFAREGLLKQRDIVSPSDSNERHSDFAKARQVRNKIVRQAFNRALAVHYLEKKSFKEFRSDNRDWLQDYALFSVISENQKTEDWTKWPADLRTRKPSALAAAATKYAGEIDWIIFQQYAFDQQWRTLRQYAAAKNIELIGDLPIFVAHRSCDVWANQKFFQLDANGQPKVVAGCPPDRFNPKGQLWGNALYDWSAMASDGFTWWIKRFERLLKLFDAVRLDHFIGFHRSWAIPAAAKTAAKGSWQLTPGKAFLTALTKKFPGLPMIAEDLGLVTPEVAALRDDFGFPGMRVLQFGFSGDGDAPHHIPYNYNSNSVVYTGTHDNETSLQYLQRVFKESGRRPISEFQRASAFLGINGKQIHKDSSTEDHHDAVWSLIRSGMNSVAQTAILQMQDLLSLGAEHRMNTPGTTKHNWTWRVCQEELSAQVANDFKRLTLASGRWPGAPGQSPS